MLSSSAWGPAASTPPGTLAEAGLAVAGVESRLVGGECPYWGCIPSKMMIRAADLIAEGTPDPGHGGPGEIAPDWAPVARRIRAEATDNWDDTVAADRFTGKGGILVRGHGRITAPGEVTVTPVDGPPDGAAAGAAGTAGHRPGRGHHSRPCRRSRAWPGRRSGPTTRRSRPSRCRSPWWCSAAGPSGPSWPRSSPGSAAGSRSPRAPPACCRWRSPSPGDLLAGVFGREGIRCGPAPRRPDRVRRPRGVHRHARRRRGACRRGAAGRHRPADRSRPRLGVGAVGIDETPAGHPGRRAPAGRARRVGAG